MARRSNPTSDSLAVVTVRHHEGSTIFSCERTSAEPLEILQPKISSMIQMVQSEVERQDGIVGHIKAYVSDSGASTAFSGTGEAVHVLQIQQRVTQIHFTAIILGCDEKPILSLIEQTLDAI